MATHLRCPDCGGIIGAHAGGEEGRPCICFGRRVETVSRSAKLCCVCGKDVSHEKRLKDDRGYWCVSCHRADQARRARRTAPCQECGREVGEDALVEYEGLRRCRRCVQDRRSLPKHKRFRPVAGHAHVQHEKTRLLILLGVLLVLMGFIVWGWLVG